MTSTIVLLLCNLVGGADSAVLRVPEDFASIGEAVREVHDGETVRIAPGTYREALFLDRPVRLVGADATACILEPPMEDRTGAMVTVQSRAHVSGLTIRNAETGILVKAGASLEIEDCRIEGNTSDGIGFDDDFDTVLTMRRCLVAANGDGVDLESTQGVILDSRFVANKDDGVDYDGDAGVLVYGCKFLDNGDDGIEIRIARRTHTLVVNSRFERNGEDGIEVIDSPVEGGEFNVLSVQNSAFRANRRFGVGFVDQKSEQHTGAMSKTAVYAVGNTFSEPGTADVSPNYAPVFAAPADYPERVRAALRRPAERCEQELPVQVPVLVGIYNMRPTTDGTLAGDVEGVAVRGDRVFVADDETHRIYVLDRRTGRVEAAIPTRPFPGDTRDALGPEGLDVLQRNGRAMLLLADDDGRALFRLSLESGTFGRILDRRDTTAAGAVEGAEAVGASLLLAAGYDKIGIAGAADLGPLDEPVALEFEGFGRHVAGIGFDEDGQRVLATLSGYSGSQQRQRNHQSALFAIRPELDSLAGFWHLGPFSNDPRGVAVTDGLVYVADGRSDFEDDETGEMNRGGRKVFVFLLDGDAEVLQATLPLLPVRARRR